MSYMAENNEKIETRLPAHLKAQLQREADSMRRKPSWLLREILAERYEAAREEVAPMVD